MNSKLNVNRLVELSLVFLISILSFTIGTYVGKKYSDNQHRLSQLDPQAAHGQTETAQNTNETVVETPENKIAAAGSQLSDEEVAKLAEEFADENADHDETSSPETKPIEVVEDTTAKDLPVLDPVKNTTKKVVNRKKSKAELSREVASISKKANAIINESPRIGSQYTIQVGSFPSTEEAEKVSESLKARGYKASQVKAQVNGKSWYRVQVGLFDNLADAQNYKKELMQQNRLSSAIIQKVQ